MDSPYYRFVDDWYFRNATVAEKIPGSRLARLAEAALDLLRREGTEEEYRRLATEIDPRYGSGAAVVPSVPITEEDKLILDTLADCYPAAVNQPDLEMLTKIPRQRIAQRLKWLGAKSRRYVARPAGTQRKGHAITSAGLSAIGRPVVPH